MGVSESDMTSASSVWVVLVSGLTCAKHSHPDNALEKNINSGRAGTLEQQTDLFVIFSGINIAKSAFEGHEATASNEKISTIGIKLTAR